MGNGSKQKMTSNQKILLQRLRTFIHQEFDYQRQRLLQQWSLPLAQRVQKGYAIEGLEIKQLKPNGILILTCQTNDSRFREGDFLVLHRGNQQGLEAIQCVMEYDGITTLEVTITDGNPYFLKEFPNGWIADESLLDLSGMFLEALDRVGDTLRGREFILPLLNGELSPSIDYAKYERAWEATNAADLNESQCEAVAQSYATDLVHLIQGPPGTGKTFVLAHLVRMLVEDGHRVLITGLTHRAINNALNKIYRLDSELPVCKIGQDNAAKDLLPPNHENFASTDFAESSSGYAIGATPFATQTQRLANIEFDVVIFDEASQITLPLAIMGMLAGNRYIFIGDDRQLPPVISAGTSQLGRASIFAYLNERGYETMLDLTYRLNDVLVQWPSKNFYDGKLQPTPDAGPRRLQLDGTDPKWAFALDPRHSMVFLDVGHRNNTIRSQKEADIIVELVQSLLRANVSPTEIGVIVPYRAQGRAIRKLLSQVLPSREMLSELVVDTVERMQGQEREVVLLSMTTSNPAFAGRLAEFYFQPERLNVSITRPRTKLIVVGSSHVLNAQPDSLESEAWIEMYGDLLAHCTTFDISEGVDY
ncbi:MAG: AAA family ATPase [Anaerolineales bacterium]|nr:AAA family ATPase [Anaerolineales bacterium]